MHGSDPLPAAFYRYRKRKRISLRGFTPGIEYSRFRRGHTDPPVTGHGMQVNRAEYIALRHADTYDPGHAFYTLSGPDYRSPEPWHDLAPTGTPPIEFPTSPEPLPPVELPIDHDLAGRIVQDFVSNAPRREAAHDVDIHELFDPDRTVRLKIGEIHDHFERAKAYESSVAIGGLIEEVVGSLMDGQSTLDADLAALKGAVIAMQNGDPPPCASEAPGDEAPLPDQLDAPDPFQAAEDAFDQETHDMGASFDDPYQGQSLEELVDEQWEQLGQYAAMDPYGMLNPYCGPPPGFMGPGMPMDPFDPMPPGLGPMGPMMGPM